MAAVMIATHQMPTTRQVGFDSLAVNDALERRHPSKNRENLPGIGAPAGARMVILLPTMLQRQRGHPGQEDDEEARVAGRDGA